MRDDQEPIYKDYLVVVKDESIDDEYVMGEYVNFHEARQAYQRKVDSMDLPNSPEAQSIRIVSLNANTKEYVGVMEEARGQIKAKPRIYIAGPMTGYPDMNAPMFFEAERSLRCAGWDVRNPARMDEEAGVQVDNKTELTPEEYMQAAKRDLIAIDECDAIYFLDGYEASPGAKWEWAYAKTRGLTMFYQTPKADGVERRRDDD